MPLSQPNVLPQGRFFATDMPTLCKQLNNYANKLDAALHTLTLAENVQGNLLAATFPVAPNTDLAIVHGLGYIPQGYIVTRRNNAGVIYDGVTAWDKTTLYLRSSVASTVASIFVF